MIIAKDLKQAQGAFRTLRGKLLKSPVLSRLIRKSTRDEIILENNIRDRLFSAESRQRPRT